MYHHFLAKKNTTCYIMRWDATYKESAGAKRVTHNHGLHIIMDFVASQSVRGVSSWSQTATENTSYLFSPTLRKVLMSNFMSPVEIHAAMKAALFLFLFILLSSFRPDIHYSFHLLRGRARHCNFSFSSLQMLSLLWLKPESNLSLCWFKFPSMF